jgi:hypothetical protein
MTWDLDGWLSQKSNVKLRPLAEQIAEDFRAVQHTVSAQPEFDQLLLTAHMRVSGD